MWWHGWVVRVHGIRLLPDVGDVGSNPLSAVDVNEEALFLPFSSKRKKKFFFGFTSFLKPASPISSFPRPASLISTSSSSYHPRYVCQLVHVFHGCVTSLSYHSRYFSQSASGFLFHHNLPHYSPPQVIHCCHSFFF